MNDYTIDAGTRNEINLYTGEWMIIDIGLSETDDTTGIWRSPHFLYTVTYGELLPEVIKRAADGGSGQLNLAIEAPLSAAFASSGNPRPRPCDFWRRRRTNTPIRRSWNENAGAATLVMAQFLLQSLNESDERRRNIRLFEGHVSFKDDDLTKQFPKANGNKHLADVLAIKAQIENEILADIFTEEELRHNRHTGEDLVIKSPFPFFKPTLIPPVIRYTPQRQPTVNDL